jgi:hypothetical protein
MSAAWSKSWPVSIVTGFVAGVLTTSFGVSVFTHLFLFLLFSLLGTELNYPLSTSRWHRASPEKSR